MDKEDLAQEQEAKRAGKEQVKKELKKQSKKMLKIVLKAIAAKAITFATIAIIATASIFIFVACMDLVVNDDDDEAEESVMTTEQEIKEYIKQYETENEALRTELLKDENIAKILEWQNNYNYTADVLIAMAFEEAEGNENFDFNTFLETLNTKGEEWNENNYKTVNEIAQNYVGDETTEEWANNIKEKLNKKNQYIILEEY